MRLKSHYSATMRIKPRHVLRRVNNNTTIRYKRGIHPKTQSMKLDMGTIAARHERNSFSISKGFQFQLKRGCGCGLEFTKVTSSLYYANSCQDLHSRVTKMTSHKHDPNKYNQYS